MNYSNIYNLGGKYMNTYLDVIKNKYAAFTGRADRKEFWLFVLFNIIAGIILGIIGGIFTAITGSTAISYILSGLYDLFILVPSLAVMARRLHDTGKSGWFILLALIPFVGEIILIVFWAMDSQPGANAYGENPKLKA